MCFEEVLDMGFGKVVFEFFGEGVCFVVEGCEFCVVCVDIEVFFGVFEEDVNFVCWN